MAIYHGNVVVVSMIDLLRSYLRSFATVGATCCIVCFISSRTLEWNFAIVNCAFSQDL